MQGKHSDDDDQIDLHKFEIQKKIFKNQYSYTKYYIIINLATGSKNIAKCSSKYIDDLKRLDVVNFSREVDIMFKLNHPSIIKFIGYSLTNFKNKSKTVIITEYLSKITLNKLIKREKSKSDKNEEIFSKWNDTNKLISIFGIASAMLYLHSNNIIHRNLHPKNIFYDDLLHPKISGFEYSYEFQSNLIETKEDFEFNEHSLFTAPEITTDLKYSKSSDVYAFGLIMKLILSDDSSFNSIIFPAKNDKQIEKCYEELFQRCHSRDPKERPTFAEIVDELKNNSDFITDKINKEEYFKYIEFIENSPKTFDTKKKVRKQIDEVLKEKAYTIDKSYFESECYLGSDLDLSQFSINYKNNIINFNEEKTNCEIFRLEGKNDDIYSAHICLKEINRFYRNEINNFINKVNIISQINHPSILNYVGFSNVDFNNQPRPVIITQNYCNTFEVLCYETDGTIKLMNIYGIASAMAYLHRHNIIHRDLKPSNIFLNYQKLPKLSGFDIAIELKNKLVEKSDKIVGTPAYLAPEVYLNKEYSKSSDVYSFGLVMYEIITNKQSFKKMNKLENLKFLVINGTRPIFHTPIRKCYRKLIERCWSSNPNERPTFEEILAELRTNPEFLTEEMDKENYFNYVKLLDEFPSVLDSNKRIKIFDDIKINTFPEIDYNSGLRNFYETETNDLSYNYNYFNLNDYQSSDDVEGHFYRGQKIINQITSEIFYQKKPIEYLNYCTKNQIINFIQELSIISQLNHPSILKFIGFNPNDIDKPTIVVEYSSIGSLSKILYNNKSNEEEEEYIFNETEKLISIYGIASGMSYLHSNNILHRDLKPSHIFYDEQFNPKISGFDIAIELKNKSIEKSDQIKGTPVYLAPEIYLNKEYSKSSDVYSFGLVVYEIVTNKQPFDKSLSPKEIKELIIKGERPEFIIPIKECYRNLIERCWSSDPNKRPTFEEILTELKTNPEFLTGEINKEEYFEYVEFIEKSNFSFDSTKRISLYDYIIKYQLSNYNEINTEINFFHIYETEYENVYCNHNFLNLEKYEKKKLVHTDDNFKIYHINDKITDQTYLAKRSKERIDKMYDYDRDLFYNEINYSIKINHPLFSKCIGYSPIDFKERPFPVLVSEIGINGTLENLIEIDIKNQTKTILNETKRLIIIYGIAAGMLYLHSQDIIHVNLNPSNIYLDEFLFPKISDFYLSNKLSKYPIPELSQLKTDTVSYEENIYHSPEYYMYGNASSASDVYSFGMIVFLLISNENHFPEISYEIIEQVCEEQLRPKFKETFPKCYQELIEKCWSHDPKERPTFEEIVNHLRLNKEFITAEINKDEFDNFVKFIDEIQSTKDIIQIDDFIESKRKTFRKVKIDFNKLKNPTKLNFVVNMGSTDLNSFEKICKIGSGSFGVVYKIQNNETEKVYAAKISIYEMDQCQEDTIRNLIREINIISQLNHPSILQFIGFNPKNFKNKPKPVIITEYASNGSLDTIIELERKSCGNTEWNDTKKLINIYGIASGMAYLHSKNILHRDLKPGNILLDDFLFPKIADFGLSKFITEEDEIKAHKKKRQLTSGFKGTYAYCAPEIIADQKYTKAGDVYAFGLIVYEIITSNAPFKGLNQYQLIHKMLCGYRPEFNFLIPYCYKKLIEKCWNDDDSKRPSFKDIVTLLETDSKFITQNVDEEEFRDYIFSIKENQKLLFDFKSNERSNINFNKVTLNSIEENADDFDFNNYDCFIDLSKYERQSIICKGDFTKLYRFQNKETNEFYTGQISMFKIDKISKEELSLLSKEITIISQLKHPSLLKFIGYSPIDFKGQRKPIIVTEMSSNGTLEDILQIERNKNIPEWNETKKLINIYGIASGMLYLHSKGIIHRCLKPSNIFLDDFLTPKIGDFGLSTRFYNSDSITLQSISGIKGTPIYSSPEVLQSNEYSKSSDVYSFAFIIYEIITNKVPFNEITNMNQIFNEVVIKENRPKIDDSVPQSYRNLIERCWSQNPNERPSFNDIVYLLNVDSGFITNKINIDDYKKYINFIDEKMTFENQKIQENSSENDKADEQSHFTVNELIIEAEKGNIDAIKFLAKKYSTENDTENIYKYFTMLINKGYCEIPLEFAIKLYKMKCFKQALNYFTLISNVNHPIAKYFIAVMLFYGQGCDKDLDKSYKILKYLSLSGIDRATEFLENNFQNDQ